MINTTLLKTICETPGAPGFEDRVRSLVISEIKDFADDIELDNMGNVVVLKKGKSNKKRVMIGAHMDEIGFIVTHIDNNGFLFLVIYFTGAALRPYPGASSCVEGSCF